MRGGFPRLELIPVFYRKPDEPAPNRWFKHVVATEIMELLRAGADVTVDRGWLPSPWNDSRLERS
jgi:hypothetical protein